MLSVCFSWFSCLLVVVGDSLSLCLVVDRLLLVIVWMNNCIVLRLIIFNFGEKMFVLLG